VCVIQFIYYDHILPAVSSESCPEQYDVRMFLPHVLNTETLQVKKDVSVHSYAILSRRWDDEEIKFDMLNDVDLRGSFKIVGACHKAREKKLEWLWIDSVCMDKDNDAETTKSLNSMFEWYSNAEVCLTYLRDVDSSASNLHTFESCEQPGQKSVWFTRGWTLQELLAPTNMEFYEKAWKLIGEKADLLEDLHRATDIDQRYLKGGTAFREASLATRMSWMAGRNTKYVEDIAYSMLGILDVNMQPLYGEGVKAFMRLQRELIDNSTDESIFAWTTCPQGLKCYRRDEAWRPESWGLLAPSPDCFRDSRDLVLPPEDQIEPRLDGGYRWAQQGVQFMVPQKSGTDVTNWLGLPRTEIKFALNCWSYKGRKQETVIIRLLKSGNAYKRVRCHDLDTKPGKKPSSNRVFGIEQVVTRPLMVVQPTFS